MSLIQEFASMEAHIHDNKGPMIEGVSLAFTVLAALFVLVRIFVRIERSAGLWWDDYLIMAALLTVTGMCVTMFLLVGSGFGKHVLLLTEPKAVDFVKYNFVWSWIYPAAMSLTKMSILCLYRRVFPPNHYRWFSIVTYALGAYVILWTIGIYVAICVICLPISSDWLTQSCRPPVSLSYSTSILNIVSDVAILVAPQPIIWSLQKPLKDKIRLGFLFLLGAVACVISIVRTPLLAPVKTEIDYTYILVTPVILTLLEPEVGIICACAPMMVAFSAKAKETFSSNFSHVRQSLSHKTTSTSSDNASMTEKNCRSGASSAQESRQSTSDSSLWLEAEVKAKDMTAGAAATQNRTSDQSIIITRGYSVNRVARSPRPPMSGGWNISPFPYASDANSDIHTSPV